MTAAAVAPFGRWRVGLFGALLALAAVAWIWTDARMAGMDMGPGTDPGSLAFYTGTWVVMMAAMMFPSVAPTVAVYVRLHRGRRERGAAAPAGAVAAFLSGYLITWTAAGLAAYGLLAAGRALDGGALAWDEAGRWVAAGVLVLAASYELTPLKNACLTRCRGPLTFFMESWREGRLGALRMGVEHGGWCVGCCWALMAALFALGAMSLVWMIVIAALIAIEKLLPWRAVATYGVTAALLALALGVAAAPGDVPGLTVPESMAAGSMHEEKMPGSMPAQDMPAEKMPAQDMPAEKMPAEKMPAQDMPAEKMPAEKMPGMPEDERPGHGMP